MKRSATIDVASIPQEYDEPQYVHPEHRRISYVGEDQDDAYSLASSRRTGRSRQSRGSKQRDHSVPRTALTASNLKTLTEVSSTAPSKAPTRGPAPHRSPYAETCDGALSRPSLQHAQTLPPSRTDGHYPVQDVYLPRANSDPTMAKAIAKEEKKIDMDMAYGSIPPDLEDRIDLDPKFKAIEKERKAQALAEKIESLLIEAHCVHHTANHMIQHLKTQPAAAAAVALTLAELSAVLGKVSPGFLPALKAGSPAVFALLASPQFLIAAGVTVGVTVVMFGGWRIVKQITDAHEEITQARQPMAFEAHPEGVYAERAPTEYSASGDEAYVIEEIEEELSSIETWRRGISEVGEDESEVDMELISRAALRSRDGGADDDARTMRSVRTSRTSKTDKSSKSAKSTKSHRPRDDFDDTRSSRRGSASTSSSRTTTRDLDQESDAGSERSHRTSRTNQSSKSKRSMLTIEDGARDRDNTVEAVLRPAKKDNMLKNMFRKKAERTSRREPIMASA